MTKKNKLILISLLVVSIMLVATGCQSFKWGPVGTNNGEATVINNGSLAVQQGDYLYYVNGMDATSNVTKPEDNYFGKASVKGSIMKSKINEDGSLSETAVVVPKMYYTANTTTGGIYIFGEWIYYVSPSTKTDNLGNMDSALEYMRTKTDGTKTQSICEISGTDTSFIYTKDCLIYLTENELHRISYTDKKIGKDEKIDEEVSSALFTANSSKVFYVKSNDNEYYYASQVYVVDGQSEKIEIMDENTFNTKEGDVIENIAEQYTIALKQYNANENALYYTKTANDNVAAAGTYGYKFAEDSYAIDKTQERKYAVSALSSFSARGIDVGLMDSSAAEVKIYKPISMASNVNDTETVITLSAAATILFTETIDNVEYMYYLVSSKLYRINYKADKPYEELVSEEALSTSWLKPTVVGDYIYYINSSNSDYLYRVNYKSYKNANNELVRPEGRMVSGYTKYTYPDDADYTMPNDEIPAFMTDADKETYVTNHKVTNE